eukprot:820839_1
MDDIFEMLGLTSTSTAEIPEAKCELSTSPDPSSPIPVREPSSPNQIIQSVVTDIIRCEEFIPNCEEQEVNGAMPWDILCPLTPVDESNSSKVPSTSSRSREPLKPKNPFELSPPRIGSRRHRRNREKSRHLSPVSISPPRKRFKERANYSSPIVITPEKRKTRRKSEPIKHIQQSHRSPRRKSGKEELHSSGSETELDISPQKLSSSGDHSAAPERSLSDLGIFGLNGFSDPASVLFPPESSPSPRKIGRRRKVADPATYSESRLKVEALLRDLDPDPAPKPETDLKPLLLTAATHSQAEVTLPGNEFCDFSVPASISSRLRKYQREGVQWLFQRFSMGKGGILGDDMGLGKTIQIIAFTAAILRKRDNVRIKPVSDNLTKSDDTTSSRIPPVLILAPSSVLSQWKSEFESWGDFSVIICHGSRKERAWKLVSEGRVDILVTSYETMALELENFSETQWSFAVFDEVHRLKNAKGITTKKCRNLPIKIRIGLTGTLIQNTLDELWSVADVCCPGELMDQKAFRSHFTNPIRLGSRFDADMHLIHTKNQRTDELRIAMQSFFLRREKSLIADQLPTKKDHIVFCQMTEFQMKVYKRILETPEFQLVIQIHDPCECGSTKMCGVCCHRTVANPTIARFMQSHAEGYPCPNCPRCLILPCITTLLKASNHLDLLKVSRDDTREKQNRTEAFAKLIFRNEIKSPEDIFQDSTFMGMSSLDNCGKMRVLRTLLRVWHGQRSKVLLFSYSTHMLNILKTFLVREGYSFSRLDGSTPVGKRAQIVNEFNRNASKFVFLISTKAGGVGLNLTSADVVVVFDPNWNPSHDLQAQDRAFRIGQQKDVNVYRLFSSGSIEENIYLRQVDKQQIASTGYHSTRERRFFKGSELGGLSNLFKFEPYKTHTSSLIQREQQTTTASLVEMETYKLNVASSSTTGVDRTDDADEYAVTDLLNDLDADLKLGSPSKILVNSQEEDGPGESSKATPSKVSPSKRPRVSMADLLAQSGVISSHLNTDLIGASEKEQKLADHAVSVFSTNRTLGTIHAPKHTRTSKSTSCRKNTGDSISKLKRKRGKLPRTPTDSLTSRTSSESSVKNSALNRKKLNSNRNTSSRNKVVVQTVLTLKNNGVGNSGSQTSASSKNNVISPTDSTSQTDTSSHVNQSSRTDTVSRTDKASRTDSSKPKVKRRRILPWEISRRKTKVSKKAKNVSTQNKKS